MAKSFTKAKNGQRIDGSSKYYGSSNPFRSYAPTCTWYAYGRYYEVQGGSIPSCGTSGINGNGGAFYGFAKSKGKRKTGKSPRTGAIICWSKSGRYSGQATAGHVAFVEDVKSNGTITISENYSALGWKRAVYDLSPDKQGRYKYYGSYGTFQGFIYQDDNYASGGGGYTTADHPRSWYRKKYGTNRSNVYFKLRELGYSHKGTAAIMGNIYQESGYRTQARSSDGYGSEGLCQWTGGRLTNLKKFASSKGKPYTDLNTQVEFLDKELKDGYSSLRKRLIKGSDKLHTLCYDFCFTFERPAKSAANMPRRNGEADSIYKNFKNAYGGAGDDGGYDEEGGGQAVVDMQKRSSVLYSSDNFEFVDIEIKEDEPSEFEKSLDSYMAYMKNLKFEGVTRDSAAAPEILVGSITDDVKKTPLNHTESSFQISDALIQAPFVELVLGDYTVGSYKNSLDPAPNHITSLQVDKTNGEINKYQIGLVHQIRAGEDPNLLDKVFSTVRYGKIQIRYGDCESGALFKEVEAIITNIVQNRDYASARITYTLYATSTCNYVTGMKFNFPATVDRPSHVLRNLLYGSGDISQALVSVFPGMADKTSVDSRNLIPTNDTILNIEAKSNTTLIQYINYLVGCMSNVSNSIDDVLRSSNYYLTYEDSKNGAYFKITEVLNLGSRVLNAISVYNIVIGYPDGNDVLSFNIKEDNAWSLLYNVGSVSSEYSYDIDQSGDIVQKYSSNLFNKSMPMNEIQKNWWTQVINHPIQAQLVMRGLLKPINLMDYINIKVMFFGAEHMTSGLYTVVSQQDTLDGNGFKTTLDLVRVSNTEGAKYHYGGGTYSGGGGAGGGGGTTW